MDRIPSAQVYARPAAMRILRDYPDSVSDILQDSALKAIRKLDSFRGESSFNTWFTKIVIRESLLFLRSHWRDKFIVPYEDIDDGVTIVLPTREPDPFQQASCNELRVLIDQEISKMPAYIRLGVPGVFAGRGQGTSRTDRARTFRARHRLQDAITGKFARLGTPADKAGTSLLLQ